MRAKKQFTFFMYRVEYKEILIDKEYKMKNRIRKMAEERKEDIRRDRRYLHQIPEIGMYLPKTAAYIGKRLTEMGISWSFCEGDISEKMTADYIEAGFPEMKKAQGIVAVVGKGKPCILLRADMDALPIREENNLPFCAVGDCGHMCGHDSHAAMLLGAASILKEMEDELCGSVKFLFQPGEETGAGARMMVDNGLLENPSVDAAFGLHVQPLENTGELGYCSGVNSASLDTFILKIHGKGGHSSQPQLCVDPVMIMNQVYQAVNLLVTREVDPSAMATLTCGVVQGGTAVNIIPEEAQLHIGLRTFDVEASEHLRRRIPELIDHYVSAWGGSYDITVFQTPCTYSDDGIVKEVLPSMKEIVGDEKVKEIPPMSGTEDFGYVTREVPGMFAFIGAGKKGNVPLHNAHMVLDEEVLPIGAAVYANTAVSWLKKKRNEE